MILRLILAILAIGAVVLGGNDLARAQTLEYRTFQPHGAGPHPGLCSRPNAAASLRQLLRKHTSEQPNNCGPRGI